MVSIQGEIQDSHTVTLQDELSEKVVHTGAKGVLLDISGLDIVDSFIARTIANISSTTRLLGAHTVVVGMQPAVAITLVELGLSMVGVKTSLNIDRGIAMLMDSQREDL